MQHYLVSNVLASRWHQWFSLFSMYIQHRVTLCCIYMHIKETPVYSQAVTHPSTNSAQRCLTFRGGSRVWKGGVHFAEKLKNKKKKKGHSNNGCPLSNVLTIKYIKILIHSFIVKLHCLMNTVTALLE